MIDTRHGRMVAADLLMRAARRIEPEPFRHFEAMAREVHEDDAFQARLARRLDNLMKPAPPTDREVPPITQRARHTAKGRKPATNGLPADTFTTAAQGRRGTHR